MLLYSCLLAWAFREIGKFAWHGMFLILLSPIQIELNEIQYKDYLHITMKKFGMELANTRNPKNISILMLLANIWNKVGYSSKGN